MGAARAARRAGTTAPSSAPPTPAAADIAAGTIRRETSVGRSTGENPLYA
jgi:hypothetical protein